MNLLDGKLCAQQIEQKLTLKVEKLKNQGKVPKLVVILVGENPASHVYVKNKQRAAERIGIESETLFFPQNIHQKQLLDEIHHLNHDANVHGILIQMPLPKHLDEKEILLAIDPKKDVDGFHPMNIGLLATEQEGMKPCTPYGIMTLLKYNHIDVSGKNVVVIGRSHIVGRPMIQLLLQANATVTVCHTKTKDIPSFVNKADIIIVAVGQAHWLKKDWIKAGAIIIDVGMNRTDAGLVGDVDPAVASKASAMTPVPGGVGPMTIAMLMVQTVKACCEEIEE